MINPPETIPTNRDVLVLGHFDWERRPYPESNDVPVWRVCEIKSEEFSTDDDWHTEVELKDKRDWLRFKDNPNIGYYAVSKTANPYCDYGIILGWIDLPKSSAKESNQQ